MATLAIRGHATRGSEVIGLLEMLGGENKSGWLGRKENLLYFISNGSINAGYTCELKLSEFALFHLEDFIHKFPYKVGDKVCSKYLTNYKIDKIEWEDRNNRIIYKLQGMGWYSTEELQPYTEQKEETMEEKETPKTQEEVNNYLLQHSVKNAMNLLDIEKCLNDDGLGLPNGVMVKSDGIGSIEFIRWYEKPQYPNTYEECCVVLGKDSTYALCGLPEDEYPLFGRLIELKRCRDAYWKMAGDWKPEFRFGKKKYCIMTKDNRVINATVEETNRILTFKTEEMRDAFYENFKDLIEECKELL